MYYIIYKTTNLINGKIYIGKHKTDNIDDGYIGSGIKLKAAIRKYGIENFSRDILFNFYSEEEMLQKEKELVTEEFIKLKDNYNIAIGGQGGKLHNWSDVSKKKLSKSLKKRVNDWGHKVSKANKGKPLSENTKKKMSIVRQNRGETKRLNVKKPCEKCGVITNLGNLKRYHNEKCKIN
jgi:hypothetical protein